MTSGLRTVVRSFVVCGMCSFQLTFEESDLWFEPLAQWWQAQVSTSTVVKGKVGENLLEGKGVNGYFG